MNTKTDTIHSCPNCQSDISGTQPGTPCPACLMQLGMQMWTNRTDGIDRKIAATFAPLSTSSGDHIPAELTKAFPQLEILHLIGQGGMGSVYCARQKGLNRLVALKIIKPGLNEVQDFASRFKREAQALGQLSHPNIVTVYDFGQTDDLYYFIMEYIDGINLRQMLFGGKLQPSQALAIVPAICDALQYAHDKGIVHRDIKPENILVDTNGNVKIADFGLAKLLDKETVTPALTQAHHVMGTMHYMAPEQFERPHEVDHRADIYSLGVVIYELLTGELPLGRFAPPSRKAQIDVGLDEIVLQTLEKEPELRYQKVSSIKSDIESLNHPLQPPKPNPANAAWDNSPKAPIKPLQPTRTVDTSPGPWPAVGFFGAVLHSQTYMNSLYLILSLPLGIVYFTAMVVGLSVGVGTLIIWIGIFVLLGTFLVSRGFASFERLLVGTLLRTQITQYRPVNITHLSNIERAKRMFSEKRTWLGIFYLITKLPLGIVSFVATIVFITVPLACFSAPALSQFSWFNIITPLGEIDSFLGSALLPIVGLPFLFLLAPLVNGIAWVQAKWARVCLQRKP